MNIFYLDKDPVKAAQSQVNRHNIKMILESAQLLCTAHHMCPKHEPPSKFYRKTHYNHPSAIWTRESSDNYKWLCEHAIALCNEYTHRYGKIHASREIIEWCRDHIPDLPEIGPTPVRLAMPDEYKTDDPVESYRKYYYYDKRKNIQCEWKKRDPPDWWNRMLALDELTEQAQELNMGY